MGSGVRLADGSFDWTAGVDSGRVPTIEGPLCVTGLKRNQLAWLSNATVRGGGITCRNGWHPTIQLGDGSAIFQGAYLYQPDFGNPYFIVSIGGRILKVVPDTENSATITDLSTQFGLTNPATEPYAYFCQGENYLIIQAGDYETAAVPTLPLFWDGLTLRRSIGITDTTPANAPGVNEIPAAGPMDYYQGRIWYAQGRTVSAGDIVKGPSGTGNATTYPYLRDSILSVTENPMSFGGDGFTVPSESGNIRALAHTQAINTTLGEGPLYVFSRSVIYQLTVPSTRAAWIAATNSNQPQMTLAQLKFGTYSDRSIVPLNGDLFYKSPDGIRSLALSVRNTGQWGNTPISDNEERVFQFEDRSLLRYTSGVSFNNRLLMLALPRETPVGVGFQGIIPLEFNPISTLQEKLPPAWEGVLEGVDWMQLFAGDFGGRDRAFGVMRSTVDNTVQLWEISETDRFDYAHESDGGRRVTWWIETPAFNFQKELEYKKLDGAELWIDKLYGTAEITFEWRVDADPCWNFWHQTQVCSAKSTCESVTNPICYPEQNYREGYRWAINIPKPPFPKCATQVTRPADVGFQFQLRITITGWCRVRGIMLYALPVERAPFQNINC